MPIEPSDEEVAAHLYREARVPVSREVFAERVVSTFAEYLTIDELALARHSLVEQALHFRIELENPLLGRALAFAALVTQTHIDERERDENASSSRPDAP